MRPGDQQLAQSIEYALQRFEIDRYRLPGIRRASRRASLIEQLVESVRRVRYVETIQNRVLQTHNRDQSAGNPASDGFDPLKAAILHKLKGQMDEAFWLVFLSVHFGKNLRTGWQLTREFYGALGSSSHWTWARSSINPAGVRRWLVANNALFSGRFGNHRKYESLSDSGTGAAIESYIVWVNNAGSHAQLFQQIVDEATNPRVAFDRLYKSLGSVHRFGRTARFDYLTMIGKMGLASIEPGSTYMVGATGPLSGGRLLFAGNIDAVLSRVTLESKLAELEAVLGQRFGMQVLEDALCNWQKSPDQFVPFRG